MEPESCDVDVAILGLHETSRNEMIAAERTDKRSKGKPGIQMYQYIHSASARSKMCNIRDAVVVYAGVRV